MNKAKLIKDFTKFLNESDSKNLPKKNSKKRKEFIGLCVKHLSKFLNTYSEKTTEQPQTSRSKQISNKDIMVIRPRKQNEKGTNTMTQAQSMKLDEKR